VSQPIVKSLRRWDPDRIGPYTIIGRLGAGAMGQVFLARSTAGRLVAVKTIRVELAEEPGFRDRFAREVAAARRVSGVFTAAVIEADAEADLPWVATAYVPAPSLSTLVRRCGPLPVPAVRWLAAGCAEALQSIHGVGLLHRDVKPSNVLVAPDGPRVIDFGVARAAERVQLTVTRGAAGTPAYMAPEQARDATQASPASDVFSLGATLVFAATGHPPYQGETVMDILVRLATEPPDLTGVPNELTSLVAACLERVPRDRPTDGAILSWLGPFAAVPAGAGPGHSYLPDAAMALIAEYQQTPRVTLRAAEAADAEPAGDGAAGERTDGSGAPAVASDGTSESHTALPGFDSLAAFRAEPGSGRPGGPGRYGGAGSPSMIGGIPGGRPPGITQPPEGKQQRANARPPARRRRLVWAGGAVAAVTLVAGGTALGMTLRGSGAQAAASGVTTTAPPQCLGPPVASTTTQVCISPPYGDSDTVFLVHGSGFVPFAPVKVSVVGVSVSPYRLVADRLGTFNYAFDQGHYFFRGAVPPGRYIMVATGSDGRRAQVSFTVSSASSGPPPGVPVPPGSP
jgi:Protein kinase domain